MFDAIESFEQGNYPAAAALFETQRGPLAEAYKKLLVKKGFLVDNVLLPGQFPDLTWQTYADTYALVSDKFLTFKEYFNDPRKAKQSVLLSKTLRQLNPAAGSHLISVVKRGCIDTATFNNLMIQGFFHETLHIIDVRNLLSLGETEGIDIKLAGVNIIETLPVLRDLMEALDVGDAIYQWAHLVLPQEFSSQSTLSPYLMRTAAYYGSQAAMREVFAELSRSDDEALFFMAHAAQCPETSAVDVDFLAESYWKGLHNRPIDPELAVRYTKEAIRRNQEERVVFLYHNASSRLLDLIPEDPRILTYLREGASLYLENTDLEELPYMHSVAVKLLNFKADEADQRLGFSLLERIYSLSPSYPDILKDIFAASNNAPILSAHQYIDAGIEQARCDQTTIFNLAAVFHKLPFEEDNRERARVILDLLGSSSYEKVGLVKFLQGALARDYDIENPMHYFKESHEHGYLQGTYCYVVGLPRTPEYQAEAEGLCSDLLLKLAHNNSDLKPLVQNHLGLLLKDKICDASTRQLSDSLAVELFTVATESPISCVNALFNLGLMHQTSRAGEDSGPTTAITFFEQCLDDPEVAPDARFEIARSLILLGQIDDATSELHSLVEINHGRAMITLAILKIQEAGNGTELDKSNRDILEANELLVNAGETSPTAQAYRIFLFATGLRNASGHVILPQRTDKANENLQRLIDNNDTVTIGLLQSLLFQYYSGAKEEESELAEDLTTVEPSEDTESPLVMKIKAKINSLSGKTEKTRKVLSVIETSVNALGGNIDKGRSGSRFKVTLNGQERTFHLHHGEAGAETSGDALRDIQTFLMQAVDGAGPSQ